MGALGLPSKSLRRLVLFVTVIIMMVMAHTNAQNMVLVEGPGNNTVVIGGTIQLQCTWKGRNWLYFFERTVLSHDGNVLCVSRRRSMPTPRHTCFESDGNPDQVNIRLVIIDVILEDAGSYSCNFDEDELMDESELPYDEWPPSQGYLTVIAPPDEESPHCSMDHPSSDHEVGADIQIKCISSGGVPPAKLSWYKGPNLVAGPSQGVLTHTHSITENDDGLELTCLLNSSALRDTRNCSVIVDIPSEAEIQPSFLTVESGANVSFTCIGRYFQDVSTQYTWDLPNESRTLDFDHQIQGDVLYLTNVRTTRISEKFNLTCFVSDESVGGRVWGKATLQIVSVKNPIEPARPTLPGSSSSPDVGLSTPLIVLFSCIPVVLIVITTCLILLRVKTKCRREAKLPVIPRASGGNQCDPGTDYMGLSNIGRRDEQQRPAYQGLIPEYMDLTGPLDPDGEGTRPTSETVYEVTGYNDDVTVSSNQYEEPVTAARGEEDELYINHVVVKGKHQRGQRQ